MSKHDLGSTCGRYPCVIGCCHERSCMNEAELKSKFVKLARKELVGSVIIRHEDKITSGVPDISLTWDQRRTAWLEGKYAREPLITGKKLQVIFGQKLEHQGFARFIVWEDFGNDVLRTCIVKPSQIARDRTYAVEEYAIGIDHQFLVEYLRRVL